MEITTQTRLFGIIGHPIKHSLSPVMHNQAMKACQYSGVYLAFDVTDPIKALAAAKTLGIQGLSVTIPHKVSIMPGLDWIDPMAQKIGAVNTVFFAKKTDNYLAAEGYNSDALGALQAIKNKIQEKELHNICVLGYGGAALAIAHILAQEYPESEMTIAGRNQVKGFNFVDHLKKTTSHRCIKFIPWPLLKEPQVKDYDLIVNATPQGMASHSLDSPLAESQIHQEHIIFDTVYAPRKTQLLHFAQNKGALCIEGLDMLLYQGVFQFEKFTGLEAPIDVMRQALQNHIQ